jgi:hypothetical protein
VDVKLLAHPQGGKSLSEASMRNHLQQIIISMREDLGTEFTVFPQVDGLEILEQIECKYCLRKQEGWQMRSEPVFRKSITCTS